MNEEPQAQPDPDSPEQQRRLAELVEAYHEENAEALFQASRDNPLWVLARQVAYDNVARFLPEDPEGRSAFVAGMGAWWHARQLAEAGWQVTLADISQRLVELYASTLKGFAHAGRVAVRKLDFCQMNAMRSRGFHAVLLMGGALSDYARPQQAIREAERIALPGAAVALSVKNKYAFYTPGFSRQHLSELKTLLEEGVRGWAHGYRPKLFSPEELIGLASHHGIEARRLISYPHFFCVADDASEPSQPNAGAALVADYLELEKRFAATPSLLGRGPLLDLIGQRKLEGTEN